MDEITKPLVWTTRATQDIANIISFYKELYGIHKAKKIVAKIIKATEILEYKNIKSSEIGAIDETFAHLQYPYRKLIEGHCKITYREGKTNIYIVRVFDTRQNPQKNL